MGVIHDCSACWSVVVTTVLRIDDYSITLRPMMYGYFALVTSCESHRSSMVVTERLFATLSLNIIALYLASLLETTKTSLIAYTIASSSDVLRTILVPPPWAWDDPSVSSTHFLIQTPWEYLSELSTMKSANTYPLIPVLGRYSMSNSLNSTAHFRSLPDALGLWSMALIGEPVSTIMV